jgi:hypothetical protein
MNVPPSPNQPSAEMEYVSLREEMLNRLSARQQLISITLTLAGAFAGLGWSLGAIVLLIYPLIALLLGAGWAQNEVKLRQLSNYIRERLEGTIPGLGWERYSRQKEGVGAWSLEVLSVGGILLLTQLLALGLGFYQITQGYAGGPIQWILLLLDIAAVVALLWLISYVRDQSQ